MKLYLNSTSNLGDFLNAMPVLSGLSKYTGKYDFTVKGEMKKFKGFKEFLLYQDLFTSVNYIHPLGMYGA